MRVAQAEVPAEMHFGRVVQHLATDKHLRSIASFRNFSGLLEDFDGFIIFPSVMQDDSKVAQPLRYWHSFLSVSFLGYVDAQFHVLLREVQLEAFTERKCEDV